MNWKCATTYLTNHFPPNGLFPPNRFPVPGLPWFGGWPWGAFGGRFWGGPPGPPGPPGPGPPLYCIWGGIPPLCMLGGIPPLYIFGGIPPLYIFGFGPGPPPLGGPPYATLWPRLSSIAYDLSTASSSSSPTVLAEISGSLWSTLREFLSTPSTSVSAFLRSVILAGSPRVDDRPLFVLTWL